MRNKYLFILLFSCFIGFSQQYNYVKVDDTYTPEKLIKEVLVHSQCDLVSNVKYQNGDGSPATLQYYTLGYFKKNGSTFPYDDGIVLSTTETPYVEGPYYGYNGRPLEGRGSNDERWAGDQDLLDAIQDGGGAPYTRFRSTMIEFDFIPVQSTVNFEYLFASNSYHQSCGEVCNNGAMFAAWLIDTSTGVGQNLAKIPNTNLPISINTIRDISKSGAACASANEQYFGNYYDNGQINPLSSPIDFVGSTLPMTSLVANVVVGRKYKIKLAVMDFCPTVSHNSAVFFKAGSFDIGNLDLGDPVLIVDGNGLCVGDSYTLKSGMDPKLFTFEWYKDDIKIPGQTGSDLVVTETGNYKVRASIPNVAACVLESAPVLVEFYEYVKLDKSPLNLQNCPSSGLTTRFDLNDAMIGTTSNTSLNFSYYLSKSDADNDVNKISNLYDLSNSSPSGRTIWVRVYALNNPCVYVTSFTLSFINCVLTLNQLDNLSICEGDAVQTFDLTVQTPLVYNNASGYAVSYHLSQQDANANQSAISAGSLATYNGTHGQRIWVRVTSSSNPQIYGVTSFYLFRYRLPQVQSTILPLTACGKGNTGIGDFDLNIAYGLIPTTSVGVSLEFYANYNDALLGDVTLMLPSKYTGTAGTIYVRVRNLDGDCFVIVPLQLQIITTPTANAVGPIKECDLNNDGFTVFNLDPYKVLIMGNPIPTNGVITYHETQADADNYVNVIQNTGSYTNKVKNQQTIYARVGYTNSSCYATVPLTLIVNKTPSIKPIGRMTICDINDDGVETIDLRSKESEMLKGLIATDYTVTYHITSAAAMSGSGIIGNPANFSTSVSKVVYVRVQDKVTGCFAVTRIDLELVSLPTVSNPLPVYAKCDTDGNGFEFFDLASLIPGIIGTQRGLDVTFHYTNADAQAGTPTLPLQYQNGSANVQTIFVRVFNPYTGCFVITTLQLQVRANPVLNMPLEPFVICSDTGGYGAINIYLYGKDLVDATGQNYDFQFYETQSDAENKVNQIGNPIAYNNLKPGNPIVWIRVEDVISGCFSVYPIAFQLVVPPKLPVSLPTLVECDVVGNRQDGVTLFNLTQQNAALIAAQTGTGTYQIRYFTSQSLADSNTNWIGDPSQFQNTGNPQRIWVRVEDTSQPGGCNRIMSFEIKVNAPKVLKQALPLVYCDTGLPNDGKMQFDLTIREHDILGGQPPFTVVTYHLTQQDAEYGLNKISDPGKFHNTVNPQTIYVSVLNEHSCRSFTTLTLRVLPVPEPNMNPVPLEMCEEIGDNGLPTGMAIFDLTSAESDLSNYGDYEYSYFTTETGAQTGDPASRIGTPTNYLSASDTIYVRVVNTFSDTNMQCFTVVALKILVNKLPKVGPMTTLAACMDTPTQTAKFNLHDKDTQALAGANADNFIVTYYGSEEGAINNLNPLPYIYTNTTVNQQMIWVRVENKETGCFNIANFLIQIEQAVYAYRPGNTEFCENDFENDGVALIDLTRLDMDIIGNQPIGGDLLVRYYRYNGRDITTPVNTQVYNGEVIRAEVYNKDSNLVCSNTVEFEIRIKEAPEVLPLKDGIVCYEYRDQWSIVSGHYLDTGIRETGYIFSWTWNTNAVTEGVADILDGGRRLYAKRGGVYMVTVIGPNGCSTVRKARVDEAQSITIDEVRLTDSFSDTNGLEVIASALDVFKLEYRLDDGTWQDSNIFLNVTSGEHTVYVRIKDEVSCEVSKVVTVMDFPKFFTPNNDGYNDTWNIWSLKNQPKAKIYIFDRFGKLLKELSPAGAGWDGTFSGQPLPSTDYWFKTEYIDPKTGLQKEATGHFSLKR